MRWLLDEMLPKATCTQLEAAGHDAISVQDSGLAGVEDDRVFEFAVRENRVIVTENFADYAVLLQQRLNRNEPCVPVVFVRKSDFSRARGSLTSQLAKRLDAWASAHPDPYLGPHWP